MKVFLLLVSFGWLACAPHDAGFGDVRRSVHERTGRIVRWDPDSELASEPPREVLRLLERPLKALDAVQVALLNNRRMQVQFERLGLARAALVDATLLPNPRVDAEIRTGDATHETERELTAVIDLVDLLLIPQRRSVASAELEATKLEVAGAVLDLAFDTRVAFYELQASAQRLELRRTVVEAALASAEAARELHEAGNVPLLDFESEQALYDESRLAVADAELALDEARERLQVLMGLWGRYTRWIAEGRLADPPPEEIALDRLERRAIARSLDLAAERERIEAAAARVGLARAEGLLPDLEVGVAAGPDSDGLHLGPAASVEVPLFDQGQGETGAAWAELRARRQGYQDLAVRIRSAVRVARGRLDLARRRAEYYRAVVLPRARRVLDETLLQYNAMQVGVFQLLAAKRAEIDGGRRYIDALLAYWVARAALDQMLAGRLVERDAAPDVEPADLETPSAGGH